MRPEKTSRRDTDRRRFDIRRLLAEEARLGEAALKVEDLIKVIRSGGHAAFQAGYPEPLLILLSGAAIPAEEAFSTRRGMDKPRPYQPLQMPVFPVRKRRGVSFKEMITIGRFENNIDICLPFSSISKMHAYLKRGPRGWALTDSNSTNGSRLDGEPLPPMSPIAITSGQRILLADSVLLLFLSAEASCDALVNMLSRPP